MVVRLAARRIPFYKDGEADSGFLDDFNASLTGMELTPFPCYIPMPVGVDVMSEGEGILPYDDIQALIDRNEIFAVSACQCRYIADMPGYIAKGVESANYPNQSHYNLMYDKELCIGCGACVERCIAGAVEMVDGYPEVTGYCFRCGQCGLVCPVGARKLSPKDAEEIPEMPDDLFDWINKDTMYRYEKGEWPYEMATE